MEKRTSKDRRDGKKPYGRDGHSGKSSSHGHRKEGPGNDEDNRKQGRPQREDYKKREDNRQEGQSRNEGYKKRDSNRYQDQTRRDDFRKRDDNRFEGQSRKDGYRRFDKPRDEKPRSSERYGSGDSRSSHDRGGRDHFRRKDESGSSRESRPYKREGFQKDSSSGQRPFSRSYESRGDRSYGDKGTYKPIWKKKGDKLHQGKSTRQPEVKFGEDGTIRLNKYIANSGVCSRREADLLITAGAITVNGVVVTTLGTKVKKEDIVIYDGQKLTAEGKVYVLLNKPKDFITTSDDPQGRKTVMDLIKGAGDARLFPVGRLDRNTTGLLLLTNDGELTKKLTHPKHSVKKLYHAHLDKPLTRADMGVLVNGVELDGEKIVPDTIAFVGDGEDKTQVGIEIHSGQNRVVRRMFESLDYKVEKLDRVLFAGLSKRDLPRGQWRFLTEKEINFLKML
jgi:23S rRNA pseudouridine2605 synthase